MKTDNGAATNTQFSVFMANKPVLLAQVFQQLANDKINILALSMMDATEHGVLRIVAEQPDRVRSALSALDVPTAETRVLTTTLPNRPGAMADVVERLSASHVGVNYAYCTAGASNGKTLGVFCVSDIKKAEKVLSERKPRRKARATAVRKRAGAVRR